MLRQALCVGPALLLTACNYGGHASEETVAPDPGVVENGQHLTKDAAIGGRSAVNQPPASSTPIDGAPTAH